MQRIAAALLLASGPVAGQEAPPGPTGWSGEVQLGVLTTSGNSETRSINGKLQLDFASERWNSSFITTAINAADEGQTTTERYTAFEKLDFNLSPRNYLFGSLEYEKDLFGGVRDRSSETLGYGHRLLMGPVHRLEAEIGAGTRQSQQQQTETDAGDDEDDLIGRAAARYEWKITEHNSFLESLKAEHGTSNTFSEAVTELKLSIIGDLFASVSLTARHNSNVPSGTRRADLFTAVNLSYTFGRK